MSKTSDMVGKVYNYYTVIGTAKSDPHRNPFVICKCVCGNIKRVSAYKIRVGQIKSCGCKHAECARKNNTTHGQARTRLYHRWRAMLNRCYRKKDIQYQDYGFRGITVCDRWHRFENFYFDMGDPPKGFVIDRIDNNKGYSKENCRWVSYKESSANTTRKKLWVVNGKEYLDIHRAAQKNQVSRSTIARWCGADNNRPHMKKANCTFKNLYSI